MKKNKDKPSAGPAQSQAHTGIGASDGFCPLSRMDWILAPVISAAAALWIFFHIYSAINWDDLLYMNLAVNTEGQAHILNRYGHIYILKFFRLLFFDTLFGCRVYWIFFFTAVSTLTYWSAKLLSGRKGIVPAVMAVLLIFMVPLFGREAGSPLADFTVMLLVTLGVFIYIAFLCRPVKRRNIFLMLLGFIMLWAVRSKETGVCLLPLVFGLGFDFEGKWAFRRFAKEVGWLILGGLCGLLVFMLLDGIFVGDFFFSVRKENIETVLSINKAGAGNTGRKAIAEGRTTQSWFSFFTAHPILVTFILYLLAGWHSRIREFHFREKIIWIIPLFLILFLTFIRKSWYVVPRYITPMLPVMAIWAAQFFNFDSEGKVKAAGDFMVSRRTAYAVMILAAFFVVLIFIMPNLGSMMTHFKLTDNEVLRVAGFPNLRYQRLSGLQFLIMLVLMPIGLCGMLATGILFKKRSMGAVFFTFAFFFLIFVPSLAASKKYMDSAVVKSWWRFEALRVFRDDIKLNGEDVFLLSPKVHQGTWLLGRNAEANCQMINIYFNSQLDYEQVKDADENSILSGDFDYCLIRGDEIGSLQQKNGFTELMRNFEVEQARAQHPNAGEVPLVLFKKRQ